MGLREKSRIQEIAGMLRGRILAGSLAPGARMPSYEEMEREFKASRITLQLAVVRLKADGFIIGKERKGLYVSERPPHLNRYALLIPSHERFNRFWALLIDRAAAFADKSGREFVVYRNLEEPYVSTAEVERLRTDVKSRRLAGLFFLMGEPGLVDPAAAGDASIPKVGLGNYGHHYQSYFSVKIDNASFASKAVEYFVKKGRRRIAAICHGKDEVPEMMRRFMDAASSHSGVTAPPEWQIGIQNAFAAGNIVRLLMSLPASKRPNALFVGDDHLVEHVSRGLAASDVKVPADLEVVAHWNWPAPVPNVFDFTFLGYDIDQLLRKCVDIIDSFNSSGKAPAHSVLEPRFANEITN